LQSKKELLPPPKNSAAAAFIIVGRWAGPLKLKQAVDFD
jgi:hypothetical protein